MSLEETLERAGPAARATVMAARKRNAGAIGDRVDTIDTIELILAWNFGASARRTQHIDLTTLDDQWVHPRDQRPDTMAVRIGARGQRWTLHTDIAALARCDTEPEEIMLFARAGSDPNTPGARACAHSAVSELANGDHSAPECEEIAAALITTLAAARQAPAPQRWHRTRSMRCTTGADAGAVRIIGAGEGAALDIANHWGDGPVALFVGPKRPDIATERSCGVYVEITDDDVCASAYDCRYEPSMAIGAGLYAVHHGGDRAPASVWLEPVDARPDTEATTLAPASGAWRAHVHGRAIGIHNEHSERNDTGHWPHPLSVALDEPDCERAGGVVTVYHPDGREQKLEWDTQGTRIACLARHEDGRVGLDVSP